AATLAPVDDVPNPPGRPSRPSQPHPYVEPGSPTEPPAAPAPPVPFVFERDTSDVAGMLVERRIVFVRGRIDDVAANDVVAQLVAYDADRRDPITLLINSPGGALDSVVPVLDTVAGCAARVSATVIGQAHGTAALLLALVTGDRLVAPNATINL